MESPAEGSSLHPITFRVQFLHINGGEGQIHKALEYSIQIFPSTHSSGPNT